MCCARGEQDQRKTEPGSKAQRDNLFPPCAVQQQSANEWHEQKKGEKQNVLHLCRIVLRRGKRFNATFEAVQRYNSFTGSSTTISRVQMGPKKIDAIHQSRPLRFLLCAKPALISDRVNQPTA
jgi:hypothetical protein